MQTSFSTYFNQSLQNQYQKYLQKPLINQNQNQWIIINPIVINWYQLEQTYVTITYQKQQHGSSMQPILCWYIPLKLIKKVEPILKTNSFLIDYLPSTIIVYNLVKLMMQLQDKYCQIIKNMIASTF